MLNVRGQHTVVKVLGKYKAASSQLSVGRFGRKRKPRNIVKMQQCNTVQKEDIIEKSDVLLRILTHTPCIFST
jgi:hypothetical protein